MKRTFTKRRSGLLVPNREILPWWAGKLTPMSARFFSQQRARACCCDESSSSESSESSSSESPSSSSSEESSSSSSNHVPHCNENCLHCGTTEGGCNTPDTLTVSSAGWAGVTWDQGFGTCPCTPMNGTFDLEWKEYSWGNCRWNFQFQLCELDWPIDISITLSLGILNDQYVVTGTSYYHYQPNQATYGASFMRTIKATSEGPVNCCMELIGSIPFSEFFQWSSETKPCADSNPTFEVIAASC